MASFIDDIISDLQSQKLNIADLTFVLPNKRAGIFLKRSYARAIKNTAFTPTIISIEEFVADIAGLTYADNIQLGFAFYDIYKANTPEDQIEPFENVMHWSKMLIQDFNNIDRYLIPPENIFNYLSAIKEIDHWANQENKSENITNYLNFWKWLNTYYSKFKEALISKGIGYQGLVYLQAVTNSVEYINNQTDQHYVFAGFNALNKAEEHIIKKMLEHDLATIYWDADAFYMENRIHDAGLFLRSYKSQWSHYEAHEFKFLSSNFTKPKDLKIIATPKNIGQVKYVGHLLQQFKIANKDLNDTAVVLADETLLLPLLNSLPRDVGPVNITMGVPLKSIPLANLFELLFKIHKSDQKLLFYRDVIAVLNFPLISTVFKEKKDGSSSLIQTINKENLNVLSLDTLLEIDEDNEMILTLLFKPWNNIKTAISRCLDLIVLIKRQLDIENGSDTLTLEFLYRFHQLFNELSGLHHSHSTMSSLTSLYLIYTQLLNNETLDFKGEPLQGLQIMGLLETRGLDFKNVIMLSVNEGILPAGKGANSFIPFDVKRENGMPTYKEQDAVYTYHFYRLLQRAQNIHILYNSEPDILNGGEKSRFINQLEIEAPHNISYVTASSSVPRMAAQEKLMRKTESVLNRIQEVAMNGFSPSSLTNYIRNPMDFYYRSILGIKELDEVEETVASNTMGTIIHDSLEELYKPFIGGYLTIDNLQALNPRIESTVAFNFERAYKSGQRSKGKNLIIFETCKHYVKKFVSKEIEAVKMGHEIKILALESDLNTELDIVQLEFPVRLKGKVDRIDIYDGTIRIIDYKTGLVKQTEVEIMDWEDITTDYKKFSKSFQVLSYAYLLNACEPISAIEAGIISFKNLSGGFLKFGIKTSPRDKNKKQLITKETLKDFESELFKLVIEICNPDIDFIEKEVT